MEAASFSADSGVEHIDLEVPGLLNGPVLDVEGLLIGPVLEVDGLLILEIKQCCTESSGRCIVPLCHMKVNFEK